MQNHIPCGYDHSITRHHHGRMKSVIFPAKKQQPLDFLVLTNPYYREEMTKDRSEGAVKG